MAARLVLPLHPSCPHHGAVPSEASIGASAPDHAHHAAHQATHHLVGQVAAESDTEQGPQHAPSCNCTTDCCAASVIVVAAARLALFDAVIGSRNERAAGEPRGTGITARVAHRQPPATAPPAHSVIV